MIDTGLEERLDVDLSPGDRVRMRDREGNISYGLTLMIRGNPIDSSDPRKDAIVLLDDPNTKDPWGPADPTTDYWSSCLPEFERLAGRKITNKDRISAPDILETIPEDEMSTVFIWIEGIVRC